MWYWSRDNFEGRAAIAAQLAAAPALQDFALLPVSRAAPAVCRRPFPVLKPGGWAFLRDSSSDLHNLLIGVDAAEIDRCFDQRRFGRGPVLPCIMLSDTGSLQANKVLLQKCAQP